MLAGVVVLLLLLVAWLIICCRWSETSRETQLGRSLRSVVESANDRVESVLSKWKSIRAFDLGLWFEWIMQTDRMGKLSRSIRDMLDEANDRHESMLKRLQRCIWIKQTNRVKQPSRGLCSTLDAANDRLEVVLTESTSLRSKWKAFDYRKWCQSTAAGVSKAIDGTYILDKSLVQQESILQVLRLREMRRVALRDEWRKELGVWLFTLKEDDRNKKAQGEAITYDPVYKTLNTLPNVLRPFLERRITTRGNKIVFACLDLIEKECSVLGTSVKERDLIATH